ncbi:MAG: hypothetical protein U1A78_10565 [Polyangia bacterium]
MTTRMALMLALGAAALPALTAPATATPLRNQAGAYEVQILVGGAPAQTYQHGGETYVLGQHGARYTLRVYNHSSQRIEAVVSVDGRDVVDGRAADYRSKRGYLVPAYGSVDIDGWRLSRGEAAAFRFSSVASSYAARMGSAREVGVIGVAVFPERYVPPPRPVYIPRPYPRDDDYRAMPADKAAEAPPAPPATKTAPSTSAPQGGSYGALEDNRADRRESERGRGRPGLGTEFGERVDSPVQEVPFLRQSLSYPAAVLGVRYNDRQGLYALGIDVDGDGDYDHDAYLRRSAQPFPVIERRYATPPPAWDSR